MRRLIRTGVPLLVCGTVAVILGVMTHDFTFAVVIGLALGVLAGGAVIILEETNA